MKIKEIRIQNFRSLVDVSIPLDDTTVLLGENNAGKTAVLDAIRFMLSTSANRRGATFDEYDIHLPHAEADPRHSEGIILSALFEESLEDKWDDEGTDLSDVINIDIVSGIRSLRLRVSYRYDSQKKTYEIITEFLNLAGQPIGREINTFYNRLTRYLPIFHLSTLRDVDSAFSNRSPFWGKLLKSLELPEEKRKALQQQIEALNQDVMNAEPRIQQIRKTLGQAGDIVAAGSGNVTDIRALPLKADELLTQAEVVLRGRGNNAFFPLSRHGQGVQSLSVLFLFQAFVEHLLETTYEKQSKPLLTLEEPEAHLHPQAARELWKKVAALPGQKVITTHSPYFAQHVPLKSLRLLRRRGAITTIHYVTDNVEEVLQENAELQDLVANNRRGFEYRQAPQGTLIAKQAPQGTLIAKQTISENEYRALLQCFPRDQTAHDAIERLKTKSIVLLSADDRQDVEKFSRKSRGEIFFARCWLLCEGHCEQTLLPIFAEMLGFSLDSKGIALIAYQDNGSPAAFAKLARALDIPWLMFCDNDNGGRGHLSQIEQAGFSLGQQAQALPGSPPDMTLERFLYPHFKEELNAIAIELSSAVARLKSPAGDKDFEEEVIKLLGKDKNKIPCITRLVDKLRGTGAGPERVPEFFKNILQRCAEAADD